MSSTSCKGVTGCYCGVNEESKKCKVNSCCDNYFLNQGTAISVNLVVTSISYNILTKMRPQNFISHLWLRAQLIFNNWQAIFADARNSLVISVGYWLNSDFQAQETTRSTERVKEGFDNTCTYISDSSY